ncbi:MAG: alkaline phosphatase D family protein [Sphingomonas taxi]
MTRSPRQPQLDAVLHLGDYIYEYGADGYGADIAKRIGRIVEPAHEIVTLADYRQRHAQVKRDPHMQAAHARARLHLRLGRSRGRER